MSNNSKNILFRADSSSTIGTGHIMRDLVLAEQYSDATITFAVQELEGNINHKIIEAGYNISVLKSDDIEELDVLIKKLTIDLLVIDHYGIDDKQEKQLKLNNPTLKILSFDDTYEKHYCDILLNHNVYADAQGYKELVPVHCELRCGKEYTLLRQEFKEAKQTKKITKTSSQLNVFVAMGGADHTNLNISILKVLESFPALHAHVVTTTANQHLEEIKRYVADKKAITLHINTPHIAQLMIDSDFAIVTPSVTLNEIVYLAIPFIAIQTAENQKEMYDYITENNFSALKEFNSDELQVEIQNLIEKHKVSLINFIELSHEKKREILAWRNDENIRKWMFQQREIILDEHLAYIEQLNKRKDVQYFLVKQGNLNLGVIDFTSITKEHCDFGIYTDPSLKGYGDLLMNQVISYAFNTLKVHILKAEVFATNEKAISLYKRNGFTTTKHKTINSIEIVCMELNNENR